VAFLDKTKQMNILPSTPCLFLSAGNVKSTKDLLNTLSRDFMKGEGDFVKHLESCVGLKVSYEQGFIDDYDLEITNLAVDLRDGVRLTRMTEILTGGE